MADTPLDAAEIARFAGKAFRLQEAAQKEAARLAARLAEAEKALEDIRAEAADLLREPDENLDAAGFISWISSISEAYFASRTPQEGR